MSKEQYGLAPTGVKLRVKITNSTNGKGLTGITGATTGLIISTFQNVDTANGESVPTVYSAAIGNIDTIATIGTYQAPTSGRCRWAAIDEINHPGVYELQLENSRFSAVGNPALPMTLIVSITGIAGAIDYDTEIECKAQSANITQIDGVINSTHTAGMIPADLRNIVGAIVDTTLAQLGVKVVTNSDKTGYSISGTKQTLDNLNDVSTTEVRTQVDNGLTEYDSNGGVAKQSILSTVSSNTTTVVNALPVGVIASHSDVTSIQNNTKFVSSIPDTVIIPTSNNVVFKLVGYFYNNIGQMQDPDLNELTIQTRRVEGQSYLDNTVFFNDLDCTIPATASSTFSPSYYKMVRDGVGRYSLFVKVASTEIPDEWIADFALNENSNELHYPRSTSLFSEAPGTAILADTNTNKSIIAKALKDQDVSAITAITGSVEKDILTNSITLASSQPHYAPAKAGDKMDIVDAPNTTAVTVIQSGLATTTQLDTLKGTDGKAKISTDNQDLSATLSVNTKTITDGAISLSKINSDLKTGNNINAEAKVSAAPADMALDSTVAKDATVAKDVTVVAIKLQTDKLTYDGDNNVMSVKNATDRGTSDFNATEKTSITNATTSGGLIVKFNKP